MRGRAGLHVGLAIGFASLAWTLKLAFAQAPRVFEMRDVTQAAPSDTRGQVLNAEPAGPGQWPVTFVFRTDEGACTSTGVGRRVVLTAAHCVRDGQEATIVSNNRSNSVTCTHHPTYVSDI